MPVYHFTYHTYRSWNTDHKEGWHQHGEPGRQLPQPQLAHHRNDIATNNPMVFSNPHYPLLLTILHDICPRHSWHLHCLAIDTTHLHPVISWRTSSNPNDVKNRLKTLISLLLNQHQQTPSRRVFSKKSGHTQVHGKKHLTYLKTEYLPKHPFFWCEQNQQGTSQPK